LIGVLVVLVNVAFITLIERKALSLSQARIGPNKVGLWGLLQPVADAVKLFTNRLTILGPINKAVYFISPVLALFLIVRLRVLLNNRRGGGITRLSVFFLIMLLSLNVYPLLGSGWGSNRKYALLGGLRAAAQTIAYEIRLAFVLISFIVFWDGPALSRGWVKGGLDLMVGPLFLILLPWVITCVAELNRTPFDFAEGESELVSGFNIEYGSVKFAIIFMAEYGIIYILSMFTAYLFFCSLSSFHYLGGVVGVIIIFLIIWLRATLPRFRYDLLITLTWKTLLPGALAASYFYLLLFLSVM